MNNRTFTWLAAIVLALASADVVAAQGPRVGTPTPAPMLNPYLNLNRNGNSAGFNYLTLVRPMQAGNAAIQSLQQQISANQVLGPATGRFAGDSLTTGHPVMFLNTGGYFLNTGGALNSSRSPNPSPAQVSPAAGRFRSGVR